MFLILRKNNMFFVSSFSLLLFVLIILSNFFFSCSDDDDDATPTMTMTPTLTPTPTMTPSPRTDPYISDLWPSHYHINRLTTGDSYYTDSDAQISGMPAFLQNSQAISTSLSDEDIQEFPYVQFVVDRPIKLYIGYDDSVSRYPNWLQIFNRDDYQYVSISGSVNRRFQLFYLQLPAGLISLGGNAAWGTIGDPKTFLIFILGEEGEFTYPSPERYEYLDYGYERREWFLQYPPNYVPDGQTPALYYLQGAQTTGYDYFGKTVESTGLMDTCNQRGYVLIAPELPRYIWGSDQDTMVIDNIFLRDLREFSRCYFPHHPEHVYCTGFSSGAFFTNVSALSEPRFFKAIVPFAGGIPDNSPVWPHYGDEVFPVMLIVGEYDGLMDYVQEAYLLYSSAGYPVELHYISNWDHNWYSGYNDTILDFFENAN